MTERLGTAIEIVEPGIKAFCFCDLHSGAMALTPPGAAEPLVGGPGRGLISGDEDAAERVLTVRDTTPHRALQGVRLERAREALRRGEAPVAAVARRFGFSHVRRLAASYARQFGEKPRRG